MTFSLLQRPKTNSEFSFSLARVYLQVSLRLFFSFTFVIDAEDEENKGHLIVLCD